MTAFVLALLLAAQAPAAERIPVYVTSAGAHDGFPESNEDNLDTLKDIQKEIKASTMLQLTERPEDAAIVLTVLKREAAPYRFAARSRPRTIHVQFKAGETSTEIAASANGSAAASNGAWGKAAGKIVDQVVEWVKVNRSRLQ